jgi:hypothetical protein
MHTSEELIDLLLILFLLLFVKAKSAELVEIENARENQMVSLILLMNETGANKTGFWTGGIVRKAYSGSYRICVIYMNIVISLK